MADMRTDISATDLQYPTANTVHRQMIYDANRKSVGVAYLLWLFAGALGGHRFYLDRAGTAVLQLILFIIGLITLAAGIGLFFLAVEGVWVLIDAFLIGEIVREINTRIADGLAGPLSAPLTRQVSAATTEHSTIERLEQLWKLKEAGALSPSEYDDQKALLLGSN